MPYKDPLKARKRGREYARKQRAESPEFVERQREANRRYHAAHREEMRERARLNRENMTDEQRESYLADKRDAERNRRVAKRPQILESHRKSQRKQRVELRAIVFRRYGEMCACCGTTEDLTIDHINGDGKWHREQLGRSPGVQFYRWLLHQYLPPGYQTLCSRCNTSKAREDRCRLDHSSGKYASVGGKAGEITHG